MPKHDFSKCLIDISGDSLIEQEIFTSAPIQGLDKGPMKDHADSIIRYLVMMYDKGSPFNEIKNLNERKSTCAQEAGFKVNKKKEIDRVFQGFMNCSSEWFNDLIVWYCRIQGDMTWTSIVTATEQFYEMQSVIMKPFSAEKDKDLAESMNKKTKMTRESIDLQGIIDKQILNMLNYDKNLKLKDRVYRVAALESEFRPALTPEYMTTKIQR